MPTKDREREQARERKRKQRMSRPDVTPSNVTPETVLMSRPNRLGDNGFPEMVANDYNPDELLSDGRKRYLGPFSDGQVLDRLTVNSACPGNVGSNAGQHPFYGMCSVVGEPSQGKRLNVTRNIQGLHVYEGH